MRGATWLGVLGLIAGGLPPAAGQEPPRPPGGDAARPRVLVLLDDPAPSPPGRLAGQFFRQALLATAREGFDVVIRDAALGEAPPADAADPLFLKLYFVFVPADPDRLVPAGTLAVVVSRADADGERDGRPLFQKELFPPPWDRRPSVKLEMPATGLERTAAAAADLTDEFTDLLRGLRLKPAAAADRPADAAGAADPADIALRLREMSFIPQFVAVRAAHRLPPGPEQDRRVAAGPSPRKYRHAEGVQIDHGRDADEQTGAGGK